MLKAFDWVKNSFFPAGLFPNESGVASFEETPLVVPIASILTPTFSRLCESLLGISGVLQNHGFLQYFVGGSIIAFEYGEIDLIYAIR